MSDRPRVLLVDDQAGEIEWLVRRINERGYEVVLATNEEAARKQCQALADGEARFEAGIFDIMVAVKDLVALIEMGEEADLDDDFFEASTDTGVRLCRFVREELGLSQEDFPIAALSVRDDQAVVEALRELGVPLYKREADDRSRQSIVRFLDRHLAPPAHARSD